MILSRVFILVLAVAAILGLSTALLARGVINREEVASTDELLRRDRFATEMLLKLDARARLDALAPIAADSAVRDGVRGKNAKNLQGRLRTMNQQLEELRADLLIAVDSDGTIVAQEGRRPAGSNAGLGEVPLVERALSGYLGDDVWVYDGQVYRVAARPIIDSGRFVGALIHAQKLDTVLAQRLSDRLGGPTVGFFFRDKLIANHSPTDKAGAPTGPEVLAALPAARADEKLRHGERTEPFDLDGRGRAIYSLVAGSASSADVGYAVARGYETLPTPFSIFDYAKKEDVDALPKLYLGLGLVGAFLIAMGIMYLERDRPNAVFRAQVDKIARGDADQLDLHKLIRQHRMIGESMHKAIEKMVEKGGGRKTKANLDEILGPAPDTFASSAFGFGGEDAKEQQPVALPPPVGPGGAKVMPPPVAPGGAKVMPPPPRPGAVPPPPAPGTPDEKSVSVAFKLDAMAPKPGAASPYMSSEEEAHFREVFQKFSEMRATCGESTSDLTYERFLGTLQKHRDAILQQRPDSKGVRFTVYAKDGKAALKAAPRKA